MLKKGIIIALAAMTLAGIAPVTSGQTVAELNAQIQALLAQITALQQQLGQAQTGSSSLYNWTRDLTLGSMGADVKALQQFLNGQGFVVASSGVGSAGYETEYFGALTKAALASFQAAKGISPAVGYFGPITRSYIATNYAGTTTPGTTTPGTTTPSGITTPGVEAILSAEYAPSPANNPTLRVGQSDVDVAGIRVKSKQGDSLVERITVKFDTTNVFYKVFDSLSLWDGSTKLAEVDASDFVKQSTSDYRLTFTGFKVLILKDGYKDLTVKGTLYSSIESTYRIAYTFYGNVTDGIRAVDGAGINQYATISGTRSFTVDQSQAEQATLAIAKDASSPKPTALVSDDDGKVEKATVMVLSAKAEKGRVKITDLVVNATGSATFSAVYLYDGSTLISSAAVSSGVATMSNLIDLYVQKDETKLYTIKADFTGAVSTSFATSSVSVASTDVTTERDDGTSATVSGSASSDTMRVGMIAPVFSLVSATSQYDAPAYSGASGTLKGTFVFDVTASGGDVWFSSSTTNGDAFTVEYVSSTSATSTSGMSMTFVQPSNTTLDSGYYKIAEGQTARFTIDLSVSSASLNAAAYYYFHMDDVLWKRTSAGTAGPTVDYLDKTVWKTPSKYVTL